MQTASDLLQKVVVPALPVRGGGGGESKACDVTKDVVLVQRSV
jgi:hypothetical protein